MLNDTDRLILRLLDKPKLISELVQQSSKSRRMVGYSLSKLEKAGLIREYNKTGNHKRMVSTSYVPEPEEIVERFVLTSTDGKTVPVGAVAGNWEKLLRGDLDPTDIASVKAVLTAFRICATLAVVATEEELASQLPELRQQISSAIEILDKTKANLLALSNDNRYWDWTALQRWIASPDWNLDHETIRFFKDNI